MRTRRGERRRREKKRGERRRRERKKQGLKRSEKKKEKFEAQEGHEEAKEVTTQEKCVEAKKENSMHEENDVSNRHVTWWKNAWWIRVNSGPQMRTARGRRRIWRAARRAVEQACDDDRVEETLSPAEEAEGETWRRKKWEQGRTRREESNTSHIVLHLPGNAPATTTATATTTTAAAAAGTAAAVAATRLQ